MKTIRKTGFASSFIQIIKKEILKYFEEFNKTNYNKWKYNNYSSIRDIFIIGLTANCILYYQR